MQQLSLDHYTFENAQIAFKLKHRFTGDSFNLIYVVIYDTCKKEDIANIEEGKTKLRDRVRVYCQHLASSIPKIRSRRTFKSTW